MKLQIWPLEEREGPRKGIDRGKAGERETCQFTGKKVTDSEIRLSSATEGNNHNARDKKAKGAEKRGQKSINPRPPKSLQKKKRELKRQKNTLQTAFHRSGGGKSRRRGTRENVKKTAN